jgi:hypothetical protein
MTTGKSGPNRPGTTQTNIWSAKQWFLLYGAILLAWAALYLLCHSRLGIPGYEHARFSSADIRHINSILVSQAASTAQPQPSYNRQHITNTNDGFLDSYNDDSTEAEYEPYIATFPENNTINNFSEEQDRKERVKKAMIYISSQYGEEIDPRQMATIQQYLNTFTPRETGIFLADYRLRLQSFFWLSGKLLYAEVVSWVIFGVLCSLLFFMGKNVGREDSISFRVIIYQSARLLYAPFAAVMLVLVYSYIKGNATLHIEASELIIIFGFVLGFYSGSVMELLDRLRGNYVQSNSYAPAAAPPVAENAIPGTDSPAATAAPVPDAEEEYTVHEDINGAEEGTYVHTAAHYTPVAPLVQKRRVMNDDNEISEVDIDLKLDFSGLFDEERAQLQRLGFSRAIVTLHNVNGKDIIPAKKASEDMTTFVANDVKPGIYIARATLSQRLRDDQIINLFGEKTAYITEDKPGLELFVKKYEAAD